MGVGQIDSSSMSLNLCCKELFPSPSTSRTWLQDFVSIRFCFIQVCVSAIY